jgi:hypothetical protein
MKFRCEKHGEVEGEPDRNYNVHCMQCMIDAMKEFSKKVKLPVILDKTGDLPKLPEGMSVARHQTADVVFRLLHDPNSERVFKILKPRIIVDREGKPAYVNMELPDGKPPKPNP